MINIIPPIHSDLCPPPYNNTMEPKEIGFCALLKGIDSVSRAIKRPREEVRAFTSLVAYDTIPCLDKLRNTLKDVVTDIGLERTCKMLDISQEMLSLIVIDGDEPYAEKVSNGSSYDYRAPEHRIIEKGVEISSIDELRQRVINLYSRNVKTRVIQAIYDIKNINLIHAWGNWERSDTPVKIKSLQTKENILNLRSQGKTDEEIAKILDIKTFKIKEILGDIARSKLIFTSRDIEDVLDMYSQLKNKDKVAKIVGISVGTLDEWIDRSKNGRLYSVFDNDGDLGPLQILNAIECYYINKKLDIAAGVCKLDIVKLSKLIQRFEAKIDEMDQYSRKNSETRTKKTESVVQGRHSGDEN